MGTNLIAPDELPEFIDVDGTVRNPDAGWHGVSVRGYTSEMSDAAVPPLQDYLLVAYPGREITMRRRLESGWEAAAVGPGAVSLQPRGVDSRWVWEGKIDVVHVYLTPGELEETSRQMFERDVTDVELEERLDVDDPGLHRIMLRLRDEAAAPGTGGRLLVESLTTQLGVVLLRRHARLRFREVTGPGGLAPAQERLVREYVQGHLAGSISLDDLAGVVSLSRFHFARVFRRTTGTTPHEYVLQARVQRAAELIRAGRLPLGAVAAATGFSGQSHMTRVFRQRLGVTPAAYRAQARA